MMETMKKWQFRFGNEAGVRWMVYLCALFLTVINWCVLIGNTDASMRLVLEIITIPTTVAIYYISGGIEVCWRVVKIIASIINVFFTIMILLCPFFVCGMLILSRIVGFIVCCFWAYGIPILGVPLVGFLRRRAEKQQM